MKALLVAAALVIGVCVALLIPTYGAGAVALCAVLSLFVCLLITRAGADKDFLLQIFIAGLLVRVVVGTSIHFFGLQEFFGGDAFTYDELGNTLSKIWRGELHRSTSESVMGVFMARNWGMPYVVGAIYYVVGRNMLAVQFLSAIVGAATAPVIFLCAWQIFRNQRVARLSAFFVAFYPSLVLWSSQGLKDGPLVFLLTLCMLATLRLGERLSVKYLLVLISALFGILSLRFYVFYMMLVAIAGAFLIGKSSLTTRSAVRQVVLIISLGLGMTYLGVLRSAGSQFETFGNLDMLQRSRQDQVVRADSGFGQDVDVSTTSGALSTIPLGMLYLLFAPFPWQLASLRQSITLPEMIVWWAAFPLLVMGTWFTIKHRMREALPIFIFTTMLTLAYSIFQGNIGTAYRQRSQLLVFYFIFASVGFVLLQERRENRLREQELESAQPSMPQIRGAQGRAPFGTEGRSASAAAGHSGADGTATAAATRSGTAKGSWAGAREG